MAKFNISSLRHYMLISITVSVSLFLGACSVHKIDVQQGNVITQETLEKLKVGMGKAQVSRLMGTPLIEDPFRKGRWDYIYRYKSGDTNEEQSAYIILFFENDNLAKIDVRKAPPREADVKKPTLSNSL